MPDVLPLQVGYFYERPIYPRRRYYPIVLVFRHGEVATIEISLNVGGTVRDLIAG